MRPYSLVWLALIPIPLSQPARAVTPPPDGYYPGDNTAEGDQALFSLTRGTDNTAIGYLALQFNESGSANTATGRTALANNSSGDSNTAVGAEALKSNNGSNNTADGAGAAFNNTSGHDNIAQGYLALANNVSGSNDVALGSNAGSNLTTGSNNIVIGANVPGVVGESNTIRIGKLGTQQKTFIAGVSGKAVASGVGVIIGSTGQLGTVISSARYKKAIKPMDRASEAILALKPVTFRYNEKLDHDLIPQFGLIAEEVEQVNPDLVVRDDEGKAYTVRYEAVNAMLLNEFLKEHSKVEKQQTTLAQQQSTIAELKAALAKQQATNAPATATDRSIGGETTEGQRRGRTEQNSTDSSRR